MHHAPIKILGSTNAQFFNPQLPGGSLVQGLGELLLALTLGVIFQLPVLAAEIIHVERSGNTHGSTIILIPGLSNGGDVWDGTVEGLEDEYDLHVVTFAGFGGQPAVDLEEPFLPRVRDALVRYIDEHSLTRPALVGHSLGGFLAYWVAAEYPDRLGAVVAVDGVPFFAGLQNPAASAESTEAMVRQIGAMFHSMSAEQFRVQNEMTLRTMIRDFSEVDRIAKTSGASDPATVGKAMAELLTTDLRADLARITVPILQFGALGAITDKSTRERMALRYGEQIEAAPHKRFVEAATLHFIMLDDPNFFLTELRSFLGEHFLPETSSPVDGSAP